MFRSGSSDANVLGCGYTSQHWHGQNNQDMLLTDCDKENEERRMNNAWRGERVQENDDGEMVWLRSR